MFAPPARGGLRYSSTQALGRLQEPCSGSLLHQIVETEAEAGTRVKLTRGGTLSDSRAAFSAAGGTLDTATAPLAKVPSIRRTPKRDDTEPTSVEPPVAASSATSSPVDVAATNSTAEDSLKLVEPLRPLNTHPRRRHRASFNRSVSHPHMRCLARAFPGHSRFAWQLGCCLRMSITSTTDRRVSTQSRLSLPSELAMRESASDGAFCRDTPWRQRRRRWRRAARYTGGAFRAVAQRVAAAAHVRGRGASRRNP